MGVAFFVSDALPLGVVPGAEGVNGTGHDDNESHLTGSEYKKP